MSQKTDLVNFKEISQEIASNGFNVRDDLKHLSVEEIREINQQDRLDYDVMALSLTGDMNIGNIVRTSLLHGVSKVWVYGRRKFDSRGAVGSQNYLDVERIYGFEGDGNSMKFDVDQFRQIVLDNHFIPVFVEQGGMPLGSFNWANDIYEVDRKILLVMGNETNGIPDDILALKDELRGYTVSIPQRGVMRSFNVGTAMAIVAWDLRKDLQWF